MSLKEAGRPTQKLDFDAKSDCLPSGMERIPPAVPLC